MVDTQLLIQIATYYYKENMTYEEIGDIVHVSRFTVSRLLRKAEDLGIVEIKIHEKWEKDEALAEKLCQRYHLKDAIVLKSLGRSDKDLRVGLGVLAARYLDGHLQSGWTLGVSWGRTLDRLVNSLEPSRKTDIKVVQMMGHAGLANPKIDGPDIARRLAEKYEGKYFYLPAPLVVEDTEFREVLINQSRVKSILEIATHANILVSGIGGLVLEDYSVWSGYLTKKDFTKISEMGAVGHIFGQFYDDQGKLLDIDLNKRIIGMSHEEVRLVDSVICVGGGSKEPKAFVGALRGRLFNILITDDLTVNNILSV